MQIKKKQVILQSFLITHLKAPTEPRGLALTHSGNAKNRPPDRGSDSKRGSRIPGPSGNCELSVICGRVNFFWFVSIIKLSSER